MTLRRALTVVLLAAVAVAAAAQADGDGAWRDFLTLVADGTTAAGADVDDSQLAELLWLRDHPSDINTITKRQLLAFPFLSEQQADDILAYRTLNGPLRSLAELRLVRSLGTDERRWLSFFVYASPAVTAATAQQREGRKLRSQLTTRVDVPLYERAGWPWGRGIAHRWAWQGEVARHVTVGLRGEKDAGEPIFDGRQPLWDSMGGYVQLSDLGAVGTAIVGDFRAGFGEGLVMGSAFSIGKQSTALWRNAGGLRPQRSHDEMAYMRGVALELLPARRVSLTLMASHRRVDATLSGDTAIVTLVRTGLHRTDSERARRNNVSVQTAAMHLAFTSGAVWAGATASLDHYSLPLVRTAPLYRSIYPEGTTFGAVSADYGYRRSPLCLSGELARSIAASNNGWAALHKAAYRFDAATQVAVIHRFYSYRYYAVHASAFGEGSTVQNENGLCIMLTADRVGPLAMAAYADWFRSPWPRYSMSRSSDGWEAMLQLSHHPSRHTDVTLRYAVKSKEQSDRRHYSHYLRATLRHTPSQAWTATSHALLHCYAEPATATLPATEAWGMAIVPRLRYAPAASKLRLDVMAALFAAPAYTARLYTYEPAVSEAFGLTALYGRGQRLAATASWRCSLRRQPQGTAGHASLPQLLMQAKLGITHYNDRDAISSSFLRIDSSWRTDISLLARITW